MKKHIGQKTLEVMSGAEWYNKWLLENIKTFLKGDILEVGFGIGNFTNKLCKYGKVTAIDCDGGYLGKSLTQKGVRLGYGDVEKGEYFFKIAKFDAIVCFNVLEHIKDDEKALRNMSKLLKKEGVLILLVPAHLMLMSKFDKKIGHFRRYEKKGLSSKMGKAFSKKIELRYINWWAALGWFFFVKLPGRSILPASPVKIFDLFGPVMLFVEKYIKIPFGLSILAIYKK